MPYIKTPFDYFREKGRGWQTVNVLLFFLGCIVLSFALGFSLPKLLVGLGAITLPTSIVYWVGKPAFDTMLKDYFLDLPKRDLILLAKFQIAVISLLGALLFLRAIREIPKTYMHEE